MTLWGDLELTKSVEGIPFHAMDSLSQAEWDYNAWLSATSWSALRRRCVGAFRLEDDLIVIAHFIERLYPKPSITARMIFYELVGEKRWRRIDELSGKVQASILKWKALGGLL